MRLCGYRNCRKEFQRKTHNQKYCNEECCRLETNAVIMDRYYERKAQRAGAKRTCQQPGCPTVLNRYNDGDYCGAHSGRPKVGISTALRGLI